MDSTSFNECFQINQTEVNGSMRTQILSLNHLPKEERLEFMNTLKSSTLSRMPKSKLTYNASFLHKKRLIRNNDAEITHLFADATYKLI